MKLIPGIVALIVLGAGVPAVAADLGARPYGQAPAYAAPIYQWTGFYLGGHAGGAFSGNNSLNGLVLSNYDARFLGGVQVGAEVSSNIVGVSTASAEAGAVAGEVLGAPAALRREADVLRSEIDASCPTSGQPKFVIPGDAKHRTRISRFPGAQLRTWGLVLRTIPE